MRGWAGAGLERVAAPRLGGVSRSVFQTWVFFQKESSCGSCNVRAF